MTVPRKTAFDVPAHKLDAMDQSFLSRIRDHGWTASWISPEGNLPGYSFTTGIEYSTGCPEIVIFSCPNNVANDLNWAIWRRLREAGPLPVGVPVSGIIPEGPEVVFLNMDKTHYEEHLGYSRWFYLGNGFEALIMYWPDKNGKFPWQEGVASEMAHLQPDLTGGDWAGLSG